MTNRRRYKTQMRHHRRRPISRAQWDALLRDIYLPDIAEILFRPLPNYTWLVRKR